MRADAPANHQALFDDLELVGRGVYRRKRWGRSQVDVKLRSSEALTMAALGLLTEDHLIQVRLKQLIAVAASST